MHVVLWGVDAYGLPQALRVEYIMRMMRPTLAPLMSAGPELKKTMLNGPHPADTGFDSNLVQKPMYLVSGCRQKAVFCLRIICADRDERVYFVSDEAA